MTEPELRRAFRDITTSLTGIKGRIGQMGLFKTMQALDTVTQVLGFELADKIIAASKDSEHG